MEKNLALQQKESMLQVNSNADFLKIISGEKIKDSTETRIREALRYAMVKIGLRGDNFPQGIEKSLLIDHVYQNFGQLTPEEICIAFDWAIDCRLDVEDINCFENFSCAYFTKIMKSYLRLKEKINRPQDIKLVEYKKEERQPDEPFDDFWNSEFAQRLEKAVPGIIARYKK